MDSNITIFDEKYVISPTCTKTEPNFKNYDDNYLNNIISKNNDRNKRTKKLINLCSDNGYCIHINKEFNNKSIYLNVPQIEFNREPIRTNNDSDFLSLKYMTKRIQRNIQQYKQILTNISLEKHKKLDPIINYNTNLNHPITSMNYSVFIKFILESTLPINQYYNHNVEYIQNISIIGAEMINSSKDLQYLVRIYFTDIGLTRLLVDNSEPNDVISDIKTKTFALDNDKHKTIHEFQTEIENNSQLTFTLSSSKYAWNVCTIRITDKELHDLNLNISDIMNSVDEDVLYMIKDIIQKPNVYLIKDVNLYRLLVEYLESMQISNYSFIYSKKFKNHQQNDAVFDNIEITFDHISEFIKNIFCFQSTLENILYDLSGKNNDIHNKFVLIKSKMNIILLDFLKLNTYEYIQKQLYLLPFYKSKEETDIIHKVNYLQYSQSFCYHCLSLINVQLYHILNPASKSCDYTYCHYFKVLVCNKWCYKNQKRVIPQRILYNWDIEKKSVSIQAAYLIDEIMHKPIININQLNSNLFKQVPMLLEVHHIKLCLTSLFHRLMPLYPNEVINLIKTYEIENKGHYFVTLNLDTDIYSFYDLIEIHNGRLSFYLKMIIHAFSKIE